MPARTRTRTPTAAPARPVTGTDDGVAGFGVFGQSTSGDGVRGSAPTGIAVHGIGDNRVAVFGESKSGFGVVGETDSATGVFGESGSGFGVVGSTSSGTGVRGNSKSGDGVRGVSDTQTGVRGESTSGDGVFGLMKTPGGTAFPGPAGVHGVGAENTIGVIGESSGGGTGVHGFAPAGNGVRGVTDNGTGVHGIAKSGIAISGESTSGDSVRGTTDRGIGVHGIFFGNGTAVFGESLDIGGRTSGNGVSGNSKTGVGVFGGTDTGQAVRGFANSNGFGVVGVSVNGDAVFGFSQKSAGVVAQSSGFHAVFARALDQRFHAGFFDGSVQVTGRLSKGGGGFQIDHPVDPANKYLHHSFVESPDMKNVYDGVVALDDKGEAEIELPDWFSSLNKDFRYQLTAIGSPAPNLYVAEQISDMTRNPSSRSRNKKSNKSHFKVAGGASGMKVSWQVTGIRKDPWANAHRIKAEEDKPSKEKGFYLYPDLYGKPEKKSISQLLFPEEKRKILMKQIKLPKRLKPINLKKVRFTYC